VDIFRKETNIGHVELVKIVVQDLANQIMYLQSHLSLVLRPRRVRGTGVSSDENNAAKGSNATRTGLCLVSISSSFKTFARLTS